MKSIELFERRVQAEWWRDDLYEIAVFGEQSHGMPNVRLFVGMLFNPDVVFLRVTEDGQRFYENDFIIQVPVLDYDHAKVPDTMDIDSILEWLKMNADLLNDFKANYKTMDSMEFLDRIVSH